MFLHTYAICLLPIHPSFKYWLRDRLIGLAIHSQVNKVEIVWMQTLDTLKLVYIPVLGSQSKNTVIGKIKLFIVFFFYYMKI